MHDSNHILFRNDLTGENLFFSKPRTVLTAWSTEEVEPVFHALQEARRRGQWSAGYMAYEAGYVLEPALASRLERRPATELKTPLMSFGLFDGPQQPESVADYLETGGNSAALAPADPHWDFEQYRSRFDKLHSHLRAGDCFQANLTFEMTTNYDAGPVALFNLLRAWQPVAHSALVRLDGPAIISRSPELFFRVDKNGWIESKPMKGTAPRGKNAFEDRELRRWLETDPKCRSENLMIVDLLRNDLSRVCDAGSVNVPELYQIESFATVHQMISRVRGKLPREIRIIDIMRALFPCGSITGAPKIRAMEILHTLEDTDRNAYCGSIGWIAPGGPMEFNVAIRTISLFPNGAAVFNVGGGIVFDSDARSEYDESLVKARFASPMGNGIERPEATM